jgi:hypothetical protein
MEVPEAKCLQPKEFGAWREFHSFCVSVDLSIECAYSIDSIVFNVRPQFHSFTVRFFEA